MTPLMRQFWDIKGAHRDKVLLFRMGDFFEMFFEDAVRAAPLLGIALTSRNKKSQDETPMCGVPHHSIEGPINKLLAAGLKVAICDQIEDPKFAKGIVKRAVTRVLTPGMVYDPATLDESRSNLIGAYQARRLALIDTSTGECFYFENCRLEDANRLLKNLEVVEFVSLPSDQNLGLELDGVVDTRFAFSGLEQDLASKNLASNDLLLKYIESMGSRDLFKLLRPFEERDLVGCLQISEESLKHLEVFSNQFGSEEHSLFAACNRTKTPGGARSLRRSLMFPLTNKSEIQHRLDKVQAWRSEPSQLQRLRTCLASMGDLERRLNRLSLGQCNARDLRALAESVLSGLQALDMAEQKNSTPPQLSFLDSALAFSNAGKTLREICEQVLSHIEDTPPVGVRQGFIIRQGVNSQLDELIDLSTNAQKLLQEMEAEERARTGISSLKIRYTQVFGFYIEVTNTHKEKVPIDYMRKQTLVNAERFSTDRLNDLEKRVLSAQTKRFELEFEIFENLRKSLLNQAAEILEIARCCSELDLVSAFAWLSLERNYVRPQFAENSTKSRIYIADSRHPVVEQFLSNSSTGFVPNTIELLQSSTFLMTGPNMAGKSTLMRQVALTVILAQAGSFVPASRCELPVFHQVFTRIGAHDALSQGLSTFMVEMKETAQMLKFAGENSLLILDEIGRGTATHDGFCLAQAILEHLLTQMKGTTFFATHYHELTLLEQKFPNLKNGHMAILERGGEIQFLHTLRPGPAAKSYGVEVAKRAGMPISVVKRAHELLQGLESKENQSLTSLVTPPKSSATEPSEESNVNAEKLKMTQRLLQEMKSFSLNEVTPLDTMRQVQKWQEFISSI